METKELKITIPEGFEIDKENPSFEKIVFKKKDIKPRSWEEYCKLQKENFKCGYMIDDSDACIDQVDWKHSSTLTMDAWRNVLPSEELAEAFLAMMQLMSLRQAWIGDWKPDWTGNSTLWCISNWMNNVHDVRNKGIFVAGYRSDFKSLSFPTKEIATDFMNTFKDLLESAKPLI